METPILFLKDIKLTFGGTPLLSGADLSVSKRERMCVVGRNGSGKSTLLKIATGDVEADSGERFVQPGTTIRYLPQEPDLSKFEDVLSYAQSGLEDGDNPYRPQMLLEALGLEGTENPNNLSGGEMRRVALAKTLAPEPDILLLDEPTNHLDLPAIEWLESELKQIRSALVLISHDRQFLNALSNSTIWVDRGTTKKLNKNFSAFEDWRDKLLEEEELQSHKLDRKIVREEHWIVHGVSGRRKRNMRRVKELAELKKNRSQTVKQASNVKISSAEAESSGKLVAKLDKVSKSYGNDPVIQDFSTIIMRGDRVGIVGPNGAGKTTLVNLLTGKIEPDDGNIRLGIGLDILTIDQKREILKPDWTLKDALTDGAGDMVSIGDQTKHVFSYMKDFLFSAEQARTPIQVLSGGERGRLMLARGLRTPSNFLILDEPTNDLDIETLDLLQEFIAEYNGTVLLVSHDRDFLDRICTSTIAANGDGTWTNYAGGYSDMISQRGNTQTSLEKKKPKTSVRANDTAIPSKNSSPKLSFKHKHALENLPKEIEKLEKEISQLNTALSAPDLFNKEPKKFEKYSQALAEREILLAQKEEEWIELEMIREAAENNS